MDSSPSPASPTTSMSGSSSSMRWKPRRTRLWSSTSNTVIFFCIRLRFLPKNDQMHQRTAFGRARKNQLTAHQFRALAHGDKANPTPAWAIGKTRTVILYFQLKRPWQETQTHRRLFSPRMTRNVIECLLQNTVDVNARTTVHREGLSLLYI